MVAQRQEFITTQDIISAAPYLSRKEVALVEKACSYAKQQHEGQVRYSGEPYYTHVFTVGKLLAETSLPANVIIAGVLHDTIEDTSTTSKALKELFNEEVAFLVDGVSHLGEVRYQGLATRVKSLQKLFVATSKDIRVILIKLMDRLHNMRTLDSVPKEKQKRIAKETQYVYAPLADRLGMGEIKTELEELAFRTLEPKYYSATQGKITAVVQEISLKDLEKKLSEILIKHGIRDASITSRIKSAYSTYMKMKFKKYPFERIHDLVALRVLVADIPTAYSALGGIHANWQPIPGMFKDYIALPKPNGYQALHTRILIDSHIIELHILTHEMFQHSQFGVAAHFNYKEKRSQRPGIEMRWFSSLLGKPKSSKKPLARGAEVFKGGDGSFFLKDLKTDFLKQRMFVFTPKGEVVDLPHHATVIDFAFAIHSDIGRCAEGAWVNGTYTSLKHELKNGDVVTVKTGKKPRVTRKWLEVVKTAEARNHIRKFIKKNS